MDSQVNFQSPQKHFWNFILGMNLSLKVESQFTGHSIFLIANDCPDRCHVDCQTVDENAEGAIT